jgi:hypothetical protein
LWLCPFCGKKVGDNLYHLRFDHDMEDIAQFMQALERLGEDEKRRMRFAAYVEEIQTQVRDGKLTWEDYRRLTTEWEKEHARH